MTHTAKVMTQGDETGEYIVFPEDFELPFGPDDDIVLEKVGDVLYVTRAEDEVARKEYGGTAHVPPSTPETPT